MAQNGKFLLAIAMIIVILFFSSTAVAPTPPMETGMDTGNNGFGLPVSKAMVCFSVIFSMLVVLFHSK
ncbi:hypothetical protein EJD97_016829 [Solanum chilense]|uniref:Transmembrane protein n=1 Tax=Solanum chilense TaxID=4083 RepID=A0A6N2B6L8_SOLCI|nr:hypothetical protein EJD97_016829 [Solanum chilense]